MGQQQSKDELLFQQVNYGNTEGIKSLRSEGAGLEWIDREGKTPLIVACMNSELYNVAKTLIELGANVNAYRPGRHAGTPLHHAAKRGLEHTVKLLLAHGANALVMNDDCQTPLDVARVKGYTNVVRAIENHICLFSGWLREFYGPGFLEILAPQLLSRKVWAVILPCGSRNLAKPLKLELAIYSNLQDAQPRSLIALWKTNMDEPNFQQADPAVIISDISNIPRRWRRKRGLSSPEARCKPERARKTRIKLASASETDRQQLQRFCNACKGIPQVVNSNFPFNNQAAILPPTAPPVTEEDPELAVAISASIQSSTETRPPFVDANPSSGDHASSSGHGGWDTSEPPVSSKLNSSSSGVAPGGIQTLQMTNEINLPVVHPSAPPIDEVVLDDDAPVHYPSIDSSPIDLSSKEGEGDSSSCVICLDAPVEGACIPCGHMAGCMSCLNEIKSKKWGCPVCRAKIDQVVRLYAV